MLQLLRVDFGSKTGFGHLKRSEKLIREKCYIVCIECDEKYTDIPLIRIKDNNEFFDVVKNLKPKEVIVDNYGFSYEDEKKFKEMFPEIKLVCFDDFEKEHFCDEVFSTNPCTKHRVLKVSFPKRRVKKEGVFLAIGAVDGQGLMLKIIKALKNKKVSVYTTSKNRNLKKLKRLAKQKKIDLFVDKPVIMGLQKAKKAIVSSSTLALEAMALGVDFIAVKTADNQENIAKCLKKKRFKVIDKRDIYKIKDML